MPSSGGDWGRAAQKGMPSFWLVSVGAYNHFFSLPFFPSLPPTQRRMASSNSAYNLPSSSSSSSRSSSWLSGPPSPLSVSSEPIMPRRPKEPVGKPRDASSVPPQLEMEGEGAKNKRMRLESLNAPAKAATITAAAGTPKGATPQSAAASLSEAATPGTSAQQGSSLSPASPATRQAKPRGAAADRSVGSAPESRSKAVAPTSAAAAAHESEATSSGSSRGDDDEDDDDLSMEAASSAASPATSVSAAAPSSSAQLSGINGRQSKAASAALRNRAARVGLGDLERQLTPQCAEPLSCDALEALEKKLWQRVLGCDDLATFRWGDGEYSGVDLFGSFNGTVQMIELHVKEGRRGPYCCPWE